MRNIIYKLAGVILSLSLVGASALFHPNNLQAQVQPVVTTQIEFYGPFNVEQQRYMYRVLQNAAPIHTDYIKVELVRPEETSIAASISFDAGETILVKVNENAFNKMTLPMLALVLGHEMGHWDANIQNTVKAGHEEEYVCDMWALLALEELKDIDLYEAISFFVIFNFPSSPTHPSSEKRYAKLLRQIKIWEAEDRAYPNGRTN